MMQRQYQRQTAYKVWISDLLKGDLLKEDGEFGINYILLKDRRVSKVNLVAFVVDKYNKERYLSFVVDDKYGRIKLKVWNDDINAFSNIEIGDLVLVIGKIKSGIEMYIAPELIKRLDNPLWARLRHDELVRIYGKPVREWGGVDAREEEVIEPSEAVRQRILSVIERNDKGAGVNIEEISVYVHCEEMRLRGIVDTLIKEGELFSVGGRFKIAG